MNSNLSVTATFTSKTTHVITATAGSNGTISPSGNVIVTQGASKTFLITPNSQHRISNVIVDGVSKGRISSYTFSNITANHQINAYFR